MGKNQGRTNHLIGMPRIYTELHGDIECLIKFCETQAEGGLHSLFRGIQNAFVVGLNFIFIIFSVFRHVASYLDRALEVPLCSDV